MKKFISYYRSITEDYRKSWQFHGTKNFIQKNSILKPSGMKLILSLIDALESEKNVADKKLEDLESSLEDLFAQLKDVG